LVLVDHVAITSYNELCGLKQQKVFSHSSGSQKSEFKDASKQALSEGAGTSKRWEDIRKGSRRRNVVEVLLLMCESGKMRPVETIPG
jgi:hypothetical protein